MARTARREVFEPADVGVYHVYNRVVRRCFFWGIDPVSGNDFSHRREMVVERLRLLSKFFAIDTLGYAVLSNHFHLVVRNRPDQVETMSDREVARRWLMICPEKRNPDQTPVEPTEPQLAILLADPDKISELRSRLSNPSWLMRRACQHIARRCNREDGQSGRFFEERFKMKRLLDDAAVLACMAYVDLNPMRAGMTDSLEGYAAVSIGERMRRLDDTPVTPSEWLVPFTRSSDSDRTTASQPDRASQSTGDDDDAGDGAGDRATETMGSLPMRLGAYVDLLRWLAESDRGSPAHRKQAVPAR